VFARAPPGARYGVQSRPLRRAAPALALATALAIACAGERVRETTVLAKVPERIVLLPMNVINTMPAELREGGPVVWNAMEAYLRGRGAKLKTVSAPATRGLWAASLREAQAMQQQDEKKRPLDQIVAQRFVAKLRESAEFDAVIFPSLFIQRAVVSGTRATWDGVERTLEVDTGRRDEPLPEDAPIEGIAPAASLHVVVFDDAGATLHEKQAGLTLLVRARASGLGDPAAPPEFEFVPRRDPFADGAALSDGIAHALDPFLPITDPSAPPPHERRRSRDRD
jgi:hypothetical protein